MRMEMGVLAKAQVADLLGSSGSSTQIATDKTSKAHVGYVTFNLTCEGSDGELFGCSVCTPTLYYMPPHTLEPAGNLPCRHCRLHHYPAAGKPRTLQLALGIQKGSSASDSMASYEAVVDDIQTILQHRGKSKTEVAVALKNMLLRQKNASSDRGSADLKFSKELLPEWRFSFLQALQTSQDLPDSEKLTEQEMESAQSMHYQFCQMHGAHCLGTAVDACLNERLPSLFFRGMLGHMQFQHSHNPDAVHFSCIL